MHVTVYNLHVQELCSPNANPQLFPLDKEKVNQL